MAALPCRGGPRGVLEDAFLVISDNNFQEQMDNKENFPKLFEKYIHNSQMWLTSEKIKLEFERRRPQAHMRSD